MKARRTRSALLIVGTAVLLGLAGCSVSSDITLDDVEPTGNFAEVQGLAAEVEEQLSATESDDLPAVLAGVASDSAFLARASEQGISVTFTPGDSTATLVLQGTGPQDRCEFEAIPGGYTEACGESTDITE